MPGLEWIFYYLHCFEKESREISPEANSSDKAGNEGTRSTLTLQVHESDTRGDYDSARIAPAPPLCCGMESARFAALPPCGKIPPPGRGRNLPIPKVCVYSGASACLRQCALQHRHRPVFLTAEKSHSLQLTGP